MTSNCTAIASQLSASFLSTTPFDPVTSSLPSYLLSHGVLLSMCDVPGSSQPAAGPCSVPAEATHLSTSYINAEIGSNRIIPLSIGVVLDPRNINVTCVYPTDAGTDGRDDEGCGPVTLDPQYGSKGAKRSGIIGRWLARRSIRQYAEQNFGNRTWEEIPCKEFFRLTDDFANGTVWREVQGQASTLDRDTTCSRLKRGENIDIEYKTLDSWMSWELGAFIGHPPCKVEHDTPSFQQHNWWEYGGPCAWKPSEFQLMMDNMKAQFLQREPDMIAWNEIVADRPRTEEEEQNMIQALFYVRYPSEGGKALAEARALAEKEAKRLGGKLVLVMDYLEKEGEDGPLFLCPSSSETLKENDGMFVRGVEERFIDFEPLHSWMTPRVSFL